MTIKGKAFVVMDDVDTDQIIPARYLNTMDPASLAQHAMEDLDRQFGTFQTNGQSPYTFIVARNNFGCGSSREHAPIALAAAGIKAVIANSFARIYYRNSINGGHSILPLETDADLTTEIKTGDELEINEENLSFQNLRSGKHYSFKDFGPVKDIIGAGGLTAYNKQTQLRQ